ncbi:MAG: hypothetical protein KDC53_16085 [Saprospiraceae bacterium]|nr:hypothetical protein [Saprospiraceae bacterium]
MRWIFLICGIQIGMLGCVSEEIKNVDWPIYSGDETGSKFSQLDEINRDNVVHLELAWTYSCGDH